MSSFVHFLRCVAVRVLEIRAPISGYEIAHMVLAMNKAIKSILILKFKCLACFDVYYGLLLDPSGMVPQLKIVIENLKNVMVVVKSTMPSRMGKELSPAEESALYKEASDQVICPSFFFCVFANLLSVDAIYGRGITARHSRGIGVPEEDCSTGLQATKWV